MGQALTRRLAAIMFTDIVGYSRMMGEDEGRALRLLDRHDAILTSQVGAFGGQVLKRMGDSIFASFDSATNAVRCAIAIQQELAGYNERAPVPEQLAVRIGVHLGEVIVRNDDLFGDGINVAARLQPLARPGGVCISNAVYQAVFRSVEPKPVLIGEVELKNILERHVIYEFPPLYDSPWLQAPSGSAGGRSQAANASAPSSRHPISVERIEDLPAPRPVIGYILGAIAFTVAGFGFGVWLSIGAGALGSPAEDSWSLQQIFSAMAAVPAKISAFLWFALAVCVAGAVFTSYVMRPTSRRYLFSDIRGVDEWLEWTVMELGWCAPKKRGKSLQFSPNLATSITWGWMKLSLWLDGNAVTVVGPALFVNRLTRSVLATWTDKRR